MTQVTRLSRYDDAVWDYWHEYHAQGHPFECRISWSGVWQRNPQMLATAKAYLWLLRVGSPQQKPTEWVSVKNRGYLLRAIAECCEQLGHHNFASLTVQGIGEIARRLPQTHSGWQTLRALERMMATGSLPHIAPVSPFGRKTASDWISTNKVSQTRPISDALMKAMIGRCMEYEQRLPQLVALHETGAWKSQVALGLGIRDKNDFNRQWRLTQTAAFIMMLAATGMRASELLAIERGGLEFVQGPNPHWTIRSRVFKFHRGKVAHWSCGILGKRAHDLLCKLTPAKLLATNIWGVGIRGNKINTLLREWMAAQEWTDEQGEPLDIHSHQFRRTLARRLIRYPKVNLLALRDHFLRTRPSR